MYSRILLFLLVLGSLATKHVFAQGPTIAPSRLIVTPRPAVNYDGNTVDIHWKPGNGSGYIVLISTVNEFDGNGSVIEPNGTPYATNGNYRIEPASLVPKPSYMPPYPPSKTYLLRTSLYSGPADTVAYVLNSTMGPKYIVQVYEYIIDANNNAYYSHTPPAYYVGPPTPPVYNSFTVDANNRIVIKWSNIAESTTRKYRVLYSNDSTSMPYYNGTDVAPKNYPTRNDYETVVGINDGQPIYVKIYMETGSNFLGITQYYTKAYLANPPTPLPVSLVSFDAKRTPADVQLNWATASEVNNAGFGIERSGDGSTWSKLDFVAGNGSTLVAHKYTRSTPYVGAAYYRLRQMDLSGDAHYSTVRYIGADGSSSPLSLYPNPGTGVLTVAGADASLPLLVYNAVGQVVQQLAAGLTTLDMSGTQPGVYLVRQGASSVRLLVK